MKAIKGRAAASTVRADHVTHAVNARAPLAVGQPADRMVVDQICPNATS